MNKFFDRTFAGMASLLFLAATARGDIVFDNSTNYQTNYFPSLQEFGDEIKLAGSGRVVTNFVFEYLGDFARQGGVTARIRFYSNDGPGLIPSPGTVLFDSGPFSIFSGQNGSPLNGLAVEVPNSFTWTVQFGGLTGISGDQAGLTVYDPPTVGSSYRDFWEKIDEVWTLVGYPNLEPAGNFAAVVSAMGRHEAPVSLAVRSKPTKEGFELSILGESGQIVVIQATSDLKNWAPISTNALTTNSLKFIDRTVERVTNRFYRATVVHGVVPVPQAVPVSLLAADTPTKEGFALLISGQSGQTVIVQATADFTTWTSISTNKLTSNSLKFVDPQVEDATKRFYRAIIIP